MEAFIVGNVRGGFLGEWFAVQVLEVPISYRTRDRRLVQFRESL